MRKKYLDEYGEPVITKRKCDCCGSYLGAQNPGYTCGTCNYIKRSYNFR